MPAKRFTICTITGSRGEYGALRWLAKDLSKDPKINFKMIVTGSHLLKEYGYTYREIENDGVMIDARVHSAFDSRSAVSLAHATGQWTGKLADVLSKMKPDLVIVAGDRYELLAITTACLLLLIPVAHISGGEITEGAIDEQIRHATTKMSHLHFVSNKEFANRVKQMGEESWRICISGDPGLDTLRRLPLLPKETLAKQFRLDLSKPTALCTFHPVTLEAKRNESHMNEFLKALEQTKIQYVITYPNADHGSPRIIQRLKQFAHRHPDSVRLVTSLGQQGYLSMMKHASLMIGNSSSGIWEAPSLRLPVVNIGDRQKGRPRARNVVDVKPIAEAIRHGIQKALCYDRSKACVNPYGEGRASARIQAFLKLILNAHSRESLLKKKFATLGARS